MKGFHVDTENIEKCTDHSALKRQKQRQSRIPSLDSLLFQSKIEYVCMMSKIKHGSNSAELCVSRTYFGGKNITPAIDMMLCVPWLYQY